MKKLIRLSTLATFLFFLSNASAESELYKASDLKVAEKNFTIICLQCHAKDGMGKARVNKATGKALINAMQGPQIAGLKEAYALEQIKAVKAGTRKNANTISMKQKISKLSDTELAALAHYVSSGLGKEAGSHTGMLEK